MNQDGAKRWIIVSALVVGGIWWYRRWKEGPQAVMQAPQFFIAWGTVYFGLALVSEAAPRFAGAMAVLVMAGDGLVNGQQIAQGIQTATQTSTTKPGSKTTGAGGTVPPKKKA